MSTRRTLTAMLWASTAAWGADAMSGTWELDAAKSKGTTELRGSTTIITVNGNEVTNDVGTIAADGRETRNKATYICDGKEHPYAGAAGGTYIARLVSDHEMRIQYRKDGKARLTTRFLYSKDGKTRTRISDGVGNDGKPLHVNAVYARE